jgi:uncharacterized repeat protein (TIGR03803 family)
MRVSPAILLLLALEWRRALLKICAGISSVSEQHNDFGKIGLSMKQLHNLIGACFGTVLLAACGGANDGLSPSRVLSVTSQSLLPRPALARSGSGRARKTVETLQYLHSFGGAGDGIEPYGALVNVNGTLYGTTLGGGPGGDGTAYSITPSGKYGLLYSFTGNGNGQSPYAGLVAFNGTLYGTTHFGGAYNAGTVYSMTPSGMEGVLHSFYPGSDGQSPYASLIKVGSKLYGTTYQGGVYNAGTIFSMTASGVETVLHSFGGSGDGARPEAPLLYVAGTLYGTTYFGGSENAGIVFALSNSSGAETVLHSFQGSSDGANPLYGRLAMLDGTLYGTTSHAGAFSGGTVYSITSSGTYGVLHNFGQGTDGAEPVAGLVVNNGTLYGTTQHGGTYSAGTIYSITPSGAETVIWAFGGSPGGGSQPSADLININHTLYGTTQRGGAYNLGTIFSLTEY